MSENRKMKQTAIPAVSRVRFCALLISALLPFASAAAKMPDIAGMIKRSGLKESQFSILIDNASVGGASVYGLNPEKALIPASVTKMVTAAASLSEFPIGHQWVTRLKSTAGISDGSLKGDLYLVGDGDPGFVSESMWVLVNDFRRNGVTSIEGDLYVDDTKFDDVRFDPSRDPDRVDRAYDAPIGGMTFNWSAVNIYVRAGSKTGEAAKVFLDPASEYFELENTVRTASGSGVNVTVKMTKGEKRPEHVKISGSIGVHAKEKVIYRAIDNPALWAGYNLKAFLQQRGISVSGKVVLGKAPSSARTLAELPSKPIGDIVKDMMKFSNNYVAEILTKNLAAEAGSSPAKMEDGIRVLQQYLQKHGIAFTLLNPSGLTRKNKVSAANLMKLVDQLRGEFSFFPEYLVSLPIAGVDGTLKSRMPELGSTGSVRAKTGSLDGVTSLAGYLSRRDRAELNFVFLFNGPSGESWKARDLFDRIVVELAK